MDGNSRSDIQEHNYYHFLKGMHTIVYLVFVYFPCLSKTIYSNIPSGITNVVLYMSGL